MREMLRLLSFACSLLQGARIPKKLEHSCERQPCLQCEPPLCPRVYVSLAQSSASATLSRCGMCSLCQIWGYKRVHGHKRRVHASAKWRQVGINRTVAALWRSRLRLAISMCASPALGMSPRVPQPPPSDIRACPLLLVLLLVFLHDDCACDLPSSSSALDAATIINVA